MCVSRERRWEEGERIQQFPQLKPRAVSVRMTFPSPELQNGWSGLRVLMALSRGLKLSSAVGSRELQAMLLPFFLCKA